MTNTNHLIHETSPYLLQHAHNPVDWWPWCEEALQLAREQDKLILLSIGYSACHWCHVMAHESFEDPATARVMNELYINIKVDREERPDLDRIYQTAHQLLNQRGGGWPLTMILTPADYIPFFAGTYFPVTDRHGLPAFREILQRVNDFYRQHSDQIETQNSSMLQALTSLSQSRETTSTLNATPLDQARQQLEQQFDSQHAGFGKAPKFPHPSILEYLLHHWAGTRARGEEDKQAKHMLQMTLHAMASGGVFDQLGGGFYRYSVDDYWMIPHFEKMLYDNGPLLALYSEAFAATHDPQFQHVSEETAQWVIREMQAPEGGYYSTLDADSEGEEGKFYVWTPDAIQALLSDEEYAVTRRVYGLDREANFEGHWHLHIFEDIANVANELKLDVKQAIELLNSGRKKLFAQREQRIHPGRDEKILTSWNGLMIKGMANAALYLDNNACLSSAQQAVDFIRETLFVDDRLLANYKDGKARLMGYLDDYAFLLDGLLQLLQAKWRKTDLEFAIALAEAILTHFEDSEHGGFFFTAHDHEHLIQRPKNFMDEAIPSGNAIATLALARLGHLLGEQRYLDSAERALRCAWNHFEQAAYAHATFLQALEEYLLPPQLIVIRGDEAATWQHTVRAHYAPHRLCFAIPGDETDLPGLLAERKAPANATRAYVCSGMSCLAPTEDLESLLAQSGSQR